jgi:flavin-dependent dehydrogenase
MDTYDVIIVGASVSGSPTAMLLARRGYRVLLVDKQIFPRDTNSTHFIWPRGVSYLKRWGLADRFRGKVPHCRDMEINVEGISLVGAVPAADLEQRFKTLHGDADNITDLYMGPRRYFLDSVLIESAQEAGAQVIQGFSFEHIIMEDGVVKGISGKKADGREYRAYGRIVIGADGRYSTFAGQVGAREVDFRPLSTFAYYGYFSGISQLRLAIHKKGRLGTAIFPTLDDTHMVLVYGPNAWWEDFRKHAEQNFFFTYEYCAPDIAEKISAGRREEPFKSCGSMPAFKRDTVGDGWVLIGDASSFKDQVSAMGITHAFRDAELVTDHIHRAFSGGAAMQDVLMEFARVRARDYDSYFDLVCKVAEMNPYSKEEVKHLYRIRNNQDSVNAMISQFGDTLPVKETAASPDSLAEEDYPEAIRGYDTGRRQYGVNVYTSNSTGLNSDARSLASV